MAITLFQSKMGLPLLFFAVSLMFAGSSSHETQACMEMLLPTGLPLHCPPAEAMNKTDCCYDAEHPYCCSVEHTDQTLVMVVALSVIITCIALTVLVVVCCFCPNCLLYDTCRANYTRGEIIAYTKEEEMALNSNMPPEDTNDNTKFYCPQAIKIKPIADV